MATTDLHFIAGGLQPFKRGMRFLGGNVDDQVQINAAGVAMGNVSLYGTISAQIMVPDNTGTYTIISFGDDNVVEYVTLDIVAGKLRAVVCDAATVHWSYITATDTIKAHTWHHVAVTQDGVEPKLWIDGVEMALTRTTSTTPESWFKDTANLDAGSIGAFEGTGAAALTQEFKGYISDVRIWASASATTDVALTEYQLKQVMRGEDIGSPHNHWSLNSCVTDAGSGADNGTIVGDLVYSDGNEFSSRLTFLETVPLVADNISITTDRGVGFAYSVLAA